MFELMMPIIGAGIGAGGSIASGMMGAEAQDRAANLNWQINLMNYYQRERERREQMNWARENRDIQQQGSTGPDGERTKFVDGKGWVSTRSERGQQISELQDSEQVARLTQDMPMLRRGMQRNESRSLEDETEANALRQQFRGIRQESPGQLENLLFGAATNRMTESYDDAQESLLRQSYRTGASNTGQVLSTLQAERARSSSDAAMEAKLRARGIVQQEYDQKRSGTANLYNMFATRASALPNVSYAPQNIDNGQGATAQFAQLGYRAGKDLSDAAGKQGGTLDYVQPNMGWANAVGGGASALASAFRGLGAQNRFDSMAGMRRQSGTPQVGGSGGGFMTDHLNTNQGAFG